MHDWRYSAKDGKKQAAKKEEILQKIKKLLEMNVHKNKSKEVHLNVKNANKSSSSRSTWYVRFPS